MMTKEGSNKFLIFMNLGVGVLVLGCGHISHIVKMQYFFSFFVYTGAWIRQFKYTVIMTMEGSTKIVNFMTFSAAVLMLGCSHTSHYSEYALSSTPMYSTFNAIVLRDYNTAFYAIVDIFTVFSDGPMAVDMQIWALLTSEGCFVFLLMMIC